MPADLKVFFKSNSCVLQSMSQLSGYVDVQNAHLNCDFRFDTRA